MAESEEAEVVLVVMGNARRAAVVCRSRDVFSVSAPCACAKSRGLPDCAMPHQLNLSTWRLSSHRSLRTFALTILLGAAASANGQETATEPSSAPAAHSVPDTMAQRMQACTLCHGAQGRSTNTGYFPRIAGKPPGYLYHQLLHFRDGRRNNPGMQALLDNLTDDYLKDIALYFGGLDLPYPPPQPPQASPGELSRGERLVRHGDPARQLPACVSCHGQAMTGRLPSVPGLLGLPRDYLIGQAGAWQTGLRHSFEPDCMSKVIRLLANDEVVAIASWLAAQPLPADPHPAAAATEPLPMDCGRAPGPAVVLREDAK